MTTPDLKSVFLQAQELRRQHPESATGRNQDMVANRWRYLAWSLVFVLVCGFFMGLGIYLKGTLPSGVWVIWTISSGGLFFIGGLMVGWYVYLVFRHRGH